MLSHLSLLLGVGILLPLLIYFVKRQDKPIVAAHAAEALNFHLSLIFYAIVSVILMFVLVGFVLLGLLVILAFVCSIIACLKASEGGFYRYPLTIRLIN